MDIRNGIVREALTEVRRGNYPSSIRPMSLHRTCLVRLGFLCAILTPLVVLPSLVSAQASSTVVAPSVTSPELIFLDTDVGDDIDDAFAIGLALQSPELRILGITTTFGDTVLRARLLHRFLTDAGHPEIPVAAGPATAHNTGFTQARFARRAPESSGSSLSALDLFAQQVRAHPHQVTLVALGPLTTVEMLLDRDPATFHLLRRVVMMGGSLDRGYGSPYPDPPSSPPPGPDPEWNILNGISGARKLFASGVPLTLMPLDSTQLPLDEVRRNALFTHGSPLTDDLTLLYHQWGTLTPTLFDPLTIAYLLQPGLCTITPARLSVDDKGFTRREPGAPNVDVCLHSDREAFLNLLVNRLLASPVPSR